MLWKINLNVKTILVLMKIFVNLHGLPVQRLNFMLGDNVFFQYLCSEDFDFETNKEWES